MSDRFQKWQDIVSEQFRNLVVFPDLILNLPVAVKLGWPTHSKSAMRIIFWMYFK